jgi:phospholipid N-methyltransferase
MSFLKQYFSNPRRVGAVLPSSRYLANKMVEDIDFGRAKVIVEYGPGTGVFTDKLLEERNKESTIFLIEYNPDFYNLLKDKYSGVDNLHIIHGSAEQIDEYLKQYNITQVDYIVSGLPFASLPHQVSTNILYSTKHILKEKGKFITFQYSLVKKDFINQFFGDINIKMEIRNVPPAFVLNCNNHKGYMLK